MGIPRLPRLIFLHSGLWLSIVVLAAVPASSSSKSPLTNHEFEQQVPGMIRGILKKAALVSIARSVVDFKIIKKRIFRKPPPSNTLVDELKSTLAEEAENLKRDIQDPNRYNSGDRPPPDLPDPWDDLFSDSVGSSLSAVYSYIVGIEPTIKQHSYHSRFGDDQQSKDVKFFDQLKNVIDHFPDLTSLKAPKFSLNDKKILEAPRKKKKPSADLNPPLKAVREEFVKRAVTAVQELIMQSGNPDKIGQQNPKMNLVELMKLVFKFNDLRDDEWSYTSEQLGNLAVAVLYAENFPRNSMSFNAKTDPSVLIDGVKYIRETFPNISFSQRDLQFDLPKSTEPPIGTTGFLHSYGHPSSEFSAPPFRSAPLTRNAQYQYTRETTTQRGNAPPVITYESWESPNWQQTQQNLSTPSYASLYDNNWWLNGRYESYPTRETTSHGSKTFPETDQLFSDRTFPPGVNSTDSKFGIESRAQQAPITKNFYREPPKASHLHTSSTWPYGPR